jgi:hypothetical protein
LDACNKKKRQTIAHFGISVGKLGLTCVAGGTVKLYCCFEKLLGTCCTNEKRTALSPRSSTPRLPSRNENMSILKQIA